VNAIFSGFVINGRDNAPFGWISLIADDNGFSFELLLLFCSTAAKKASMSI